MIFLTYPRWMPIQPGSDSSDNDDDDDDDDDDNDENDDYDDPIQGNVVGNSDSGGSDGLPIEDREGPQYDTDLDPDVPVQSTEGPSENAIDILSGILQSDLGVDDEMAEINEYDDVEDDTPEPMDAEDTTGEEEDEFEDAMFEDDTDNESSDGEVEMSDPAAQDLPSSQSPGDEHTNLPAFPAIVGFGRAQDPS
ncbi:unnamed protein product [Alternaria alternata]